MIGQVVEAGRADDLIDALMARTGGEVLAPPNALARAQRGGEYDCYHDHVSRRDLRRLVAGGLVSVHGMQADRLAHRVGWEGSADTFVAWYLREALRGLDVRLERREGRDWADQAEPDGPTCTGGGLGDLPQAVTDYLLRLVYGDKATYAAEYAYHRVHGAPCPVDPGTDWARKARGKIDHYLRGTK